MAIIVAIVLYVSADTLIGYYTREAGKAELDLKSLGDNRFPRWEAGLTSIQKRPILGQGFGIGGVPKTGFVFTPCWSGGRYGA